VKYAVVYEQGPTSWGAYVPDLPGCVAVGETRAEVKRLIREAIEFHLEGMREAGEQIPEPASSVELVEVCCGFPPTELRPESVTPRVLGRVRPPG